MKNGIKFHKSIVNIILFSKKIIKFNLEWLRTAVYKERNNGNFDDYTKGILKGFARRLIQMKMYQMKMIVRFSAWYIHVKSFQINFIDHKTRCTMELTSEWFIVYVNVSSSKLFMLLLIMFII